MDSIYNDSSTNVLMDKQSFADFDTTENQRIWTPFVCTFPVTLFRLDWSMIFSNTNVTTRQRLGWAIVIQREGEEGDTLNIGPNQNAFYQPVEDVLAWGFTDANPSVGAGGARVWDDTREYNLKFQEGDRIRILMKAESLAAHSATTLTMFFLH